VILVSGGTGAIGSRLVHGLVEAGNKIRILTLPGDPFVNRVDGLGCEIVYADVSDAPSLAGAFDGVKTVYHLAAVLLAQDPAVFERVNVGGTRNMLDGAIAAGAEHFVLVSSASVVYEQTTAYSLSKRECERIVSSQDRIRYTIVRPTLAYSATGGEEFMMFLDNLKKFPVVPFIGRGKALKAPVHVDDLMRGFLAIPGNPKSYGQTYNLSGGEEITIRDLGKLMLKHQGISKPFITVPVWLCRIMAWAMRHTMKRPPLTWNAIAGIIQNANLDHSSATRDLDYHPIGIHEGLERCFPLPK